MSMLLYLAYSLKGLLINIHLQYIGHNVVFLCFFNFNFNTKSLSGRVYSCRLTGTISHLVCFVLSGFDKELEKTWQQDGLTQNVLISNENQTGRVCELLWHFQGQCTQFTIFVNKLAMAASPLCDGCVPWLLLSLLYSFASHQSVSWVKDLISAVALENVLCCSPSLRTQAAQWENTCQTTPCCIVVIVGFEWLLASEPLFPSSKKAARQHQTSPSYHF